MKPKPLILLIILLAGASKAFSQLVVIDEPLAQNLVQKLVGNGISISNISFRGNSLMAGHFYNTGGTNINLDSGIVLTTGRAKTLGTSYGVNGNGISQAQQVLADRSWGLGGDPELSAAISNPDLHDACVLEFDFVPLGDSIQFNYVFSSEEYTPQFVCAFNDAFAFFISGPGITGLKNIALIPATNIPVSIFNVNNVLNSAGVPLCRNNPIYYVDNTTNRNFTHDGHTVVFKANERVQPCQTYHLKIVIADADDSFYDSGVFLGAKSLTSNVIAMSNQSFTDPQTGNSYLVEGCTPGVLYLTRPQRDPFPLNINLSYGGTAINGIDVTMLPTSVIIPANDSVISIPVIPLTDALAEGIETLKVYANSSCANGTPTDSIVLEIRDFDRLPITPGNSFICRNGSLQLNAAAGYGNYQWTSSPASIINNAQILNPLVTPQTAQTVFTCIASQGNCNAKDSVLLTWKTVEFLSKTDVFCQNSSNGQLQIGGGPEWTPPLSFSLDGNAWQPDSSFNNLPAGTYWVKIKDANCIDSIQVTIAQVFPDLQIINIITTPASCSGNADGTIQFSGSGGNSVYTYSLDNGVFQSSNNFNVSAGNHTVSVKDGNGCIFSSQVTIPTNNLLQVDAGANTIICEGDAYVIPAQTLSTNISWFPATNLSSTTILNPIATPVGTTWYYITVTEGACSKTDSVLITVRPAPVANAGPDISICVGKTFQLNGSGGISYQWTPDTYFISSTTIANPDVKATANISYSLYVTDVFNCRTLIPDVVDIKVTPAVKLFAGNDTVASFNQPVQLLVTERGTAGISTYSWTPSVYLNDANIANPVATLQADQRFIVTGTTPDGCEGKDDILVKIYKGPEIYVPSGFTPNKDGKNDLLKPVGAGIKEFKYFRIYNRYGQVIYAGKPGNGWDGTINGNPQPTGMFVWMAEATDYKGNPLFRKGVVSLIR